MNEWYFADKSKRGSFFFGSFVNNCVHEYCVIILCLIVVEFFKLNRTNIRSYWTENKLVTSSILDVIPWDQTICLWKIAFQTGVPLSNEHPAFTQQTDVIWIPIERRQFPPLRHMIANCSGYVFEFGTRSSLSDSRVSHKMLSCHQMRHNTPTPSALATTHDRQQRIEQIQLQ